MERDDRSPVGTFFVESPLTPSATATLGEQAAHHARVKRLSAGDVVQLTDGAGHLAVGAISEIRRTSIDVATERVRTVKRPRRFISALRSPIANECCGSRKKRRSLASRRGRRFDSDDPRACLRAARAPRFMRRFAREW